MRDHPHRPVRAALTSAPLIAAALARPAGVRAEREVIDEIAGYVASSHPAVAVERHLGNQPLYPLLISIE